MMSFKPSFRHSPDNSFVQHIAHGQGHDGDHHQPQHQHQHQRVLYNFPSVPMDQTVYGCYEANAQFHYGHTPDFDKNLLRRHDLPVYEHPNDVAWNEPTAAGAGAGLAGSLTGSMSAAGASSGGVVTQLSAHERQPFLRRLLSVYGAHGLTGLCEELGSLPTSFSTLGSTSSSSLAASAAASSRQQAGLHSRVPDAVRNGARLLLKLIDAIHAPINPWLIANKTDEFDFRHIKGGDWSASTIRACQWHPHGSKFCVAFRNDTVKVYSTSHPPIVLKHPRQLNVTCVAWKPFHTSILAVGCADCIIIWDTETLPVSIKPASSCSFVLSKRYHSDITDLQWYPKSDFLLSVASKDNQIIIWDITLKETVPIKRIGTNGFALARFSANGNKLFTSDLSTTFRIWNPINYTSEKWTNLASRCNAACWSPDASVLLFACRDNPLLYALRFLGNNKQELQVVCDLATTNLYNRSSGTAGNSNSQINESNESIEARPIDDNPIIQRYSLGGSVTNLAWDSNGQRLAVTFKTYESDVNLNVVAVFITKLQPHLQVLPCGFVSDIDNSWPSTICFASFFEQGALLTIGWSNGRIQHVPFYFAQISDDYRH